MEPTFIYADPLSNVAQAERRPLQPWGAFLAQSAFSCPLIEASINLSPLEPLILNQLSSSLLDLCLTVRNGMSIILKDGNQWAKVGHESAIGSP
jgi:hypothetical protein